MPRLIPIVLLATLVAACRRDVPEGVYPCTTAADCPAMWTCRADATCWSSPGDAGVDAAMTADAGAMTDAAMTDAAHVCSAESCNGFDDDCDGLIDEGVLRVGPPVSASPTTDPSPAYFGALITPSPTGFLVFAGGLDVTAGGWSTVDFAGAITTMTPRSQTAFFDVVSFGDQVVASGAGAVGGTPQLGLFTFDFASSSSPRSFLPIGDLADDPRVALIASFDGTYAVLYEGANDPTTGAHLLRRAHVDTTIPSVVTGTDVLLANDLQGDLALLHTPANNYLAYRNTSNELQLVRDDYRATGPAHLGVITSTFERLIVSELAIRDARRPTSPTNPILFVWVAASGVVSFVEITDVSDPTSFAMSSIRLLSGTRGPTGGLFETHGIAIVPAPYDTSLDPPHWIVAVVGNDGGTPALSIVQVFEITEATVREITVPNEMYVYRDQVGLAVSGGHIRLAEAGNSGGLVTRSIACE